MKKKLLKIILISLGILLLFVLIANFGLNFWLKNNLPNYIKNNSDYKVSYSNLNVDVGTGNIFATDIKVATKNPHNPEVIGLDGNIDTLKVSRLGIWDAVFNKRISTTDLLLVHPKIKITLAKPIDKRTGKQRNPIQFENIHIQNGNIQIFRHTKQKYLMVDDLDLNVTDLQMTEKSVERKLPIVFDEYDIKGKNFYFRPDNVYLIKAKEIKTENGMMNIQDFQLIPLLKPAQFSRFYPNKKSLFDFNADEMQFKDMSFKGNKIALSKVLFNNPNLKIFTNNNTNNKKESSFTYDVSLEDVRMNNAKIEILKPNAKPVFSVGKLNLAISEIEMNEETAAGKIPFEYEKFKIDGSNVVYNSPTQNMKVGAFAMNKNSGDLRNVTIKPTVSASDKTLINAVANQINFKIKDWTMGSDKLKLDVENILVNNVNGTITPSGKKQTNKKNDFSGIEFPLLVRNVDLKNAKITLNQKNQPLTFNGLNLNIKNIEMNDETVKSSGLPFKTGNYTLTTRNFNYDTKFYTLTSSLLKLNKGNLQLNNFAMKPKYSRSQFIRMIPVERDLYDLKAKQVTMQGSWDFFSDKKFLNASNVTINGANAEIFRSKVPKDDPTIKPLYSELLRKIKFPMIINNLDLKNSRLTYEEDTKKSEGPGKLVFSNFNMNIKNLNSGKTSGKSTRIPITINCRFMESSPMKVRWNIDTSNRNDAFNIAGNIADLPAPNINRFIEPYLKIRATGNIQDLIFDFHGNKIGLDGTLKMKHQELRVEILNKKGEKNKVLSAVANLVVKTDSKTFPESVVVDNVKRDPTKSFFNLFWQGIQEGLKKTLVGDILDKDSKPVKNTVQNVKKTASDVKTVPKDLKSGIQDIKKGVKEITNSEKKSEQKEAGKEEKKGGFFKNLFKKKEKAED